MSSYTRITWEVCELRAILQASFLGELSWGPRTGISIKFLRTADAATCLRLPRNKDPVLEQSRENYYVSRFFEAMLSSPLQCFGHCWVFTSELASGPKGIPPSLGLNPRLSALNLSLYHWAIYPQPCSSSYYLILFYWETRSSSVAHAWLKLRTVLAFRESEVTNLCQQPRKDTLWFRYGTR